VVESNCCFALTAAHVSTTTSNCPRHLIGKNHDPVVGLASDDATHTLRSMTHRVKRQKVSFADLEVFAQIFESRFQDSALSVNVRYAEHDHGTAEVMSCVMKTHNGQKRWRWEILQFQLLFLNDLDQELQTAEVVSFLLRDQNKYTRKQGLHVFAQSVKPSRQIPG